MTNWTDRICETNGVRIRYARTGGAKPPVVLLHGLMSSGASWTPLARTLENDFDVIMPDARGHGGSSTPDHGYRYEDHAADVIGLTRELGLQSPFVLGHSMGGMTAAVVASRLGRELRGVILADPTFISPEWQQEVYESDVAEQHRQLLSQDREAALAQLRSRHPDRSAEIAELVAQARIQTRMNAFEVLTPPNPDYRELVRAIDAPTLLVVGDRGVVSLETARELQGLNPRLQVAVIEDAGHGLQYQQPERFEAAVRRFLEATAG